MDKVTIAMAGFGSIGRIHQLAWADIPYIYPGILPQIHLKGVCRSSYRRAEETVRSSGFEKAYRDYDDLLADPEVDVVDLVTPNAGHREQILKAMKAGKHLLCEKPLVLNASEALELEKAALNSQVRIGMIFNYRFIPAIMKAREMITEGLLGEVYSFRGEYFHTGYQNPRRPYSWRMDFNQSGGGALADLGIHVIDLVRYLLGDFDSVRSDLKTYITERPLPGGGSETGQVTVDDAAWMQCRLISGAMGSIEVSRFATGTLDDLNLTVYGSRGAFCFKLMEPNFLMWFDEKNRSRGWSRIETLQTYPDAVIPAPRSVIGWTRFHTENQYRFLKSILENREFSPSLADGAAAQYILDAAYKSARTGAYTQIRSSSVS